jgi:hypothetical protein
LKGALKIRMGLSLVREATVKVIEKGKPKYRIGPVKCSEMYLIVILNPKKTKASVEERGIGLCKGCIR